MSGASSSKSREALQEELNAAQQLALTELSGELRFGDARIADLEAAVQGLQTSLATERGQRQTAEDSVLLRCRYSLLRSKF